MLNNLAEAFDAIEEWYEFMRAYAAQGASTDDGPELRSPLREYLRRAAAAIAEIPDICREVVAERAVEPREAYDRFFAVLERHAHDSLAAVDLVQAQSRISAQMIDHLTASTHVKALLTDIFLIDEIFDGRRAPA
jgi:hypothetical protein